MDDQPNQKEVEIPTLKEIKINKTSSPKNKGSFHDFSELDESTLEAHDEESKMLEEKLFEDRKVFSSAFLYPLPDYHHPDSGDFEVDINSIKIRPSAAKRFQGDTFSFKSLYAFRMALSSLIAMIIRFLLLNYYHVDSFPIQNLISMVLLPVISVRIVGFTVGSSLRSCYLVLVSSIISALIFTPFVYFCKYALANSSSVALNSFTISYAVIVTFVATLQRPEPLLLKMGLLNFFIIVFNFQAASLKDNPEYLFGPILTVTVSTISALMATFFPFPLYACRTAHEDLISAADILCKIYIHNYRMIKQESDLVTFISKNEISESLPLARKLIATVDSNIKLAEFEFVKKSTIDNLKNRSLNLKVILNCLESMNNLGKNSNSLIAKEMFERSKTTLHIGRDAAVIALMNFQYCKDFSKESVDPAKDIQNLISAQYKGADAFLNARKELLWINKEKRSWTMRQLMHYNSFIFYESCIKRSILFSFDKSFSEKHMLKFKSFEIFSQVELTNNPILTDKMKILPSDKVIEKKSCWSNVVYKVCCSCTRGSSQLFAKKRLDADSAHRFKHAFQLSLAVLISLVFLQVQDLNNFAALSNWTTFTVIFVSSDFIGGTLLVCLRRLVGTVLGGITGGLILLVANDNYIIICAITFIWMAICGYITAHPVHSYGGYVAGFTCLIILFGGAQTAQDIEAFAFKRIEQTYYGILLYFVILGVFFPVLDATLARNHTKAILKDVEICVNSTFSEYEGINMDAAKKPLIAYQLQISKGIDRLSEVIDAARAAPNLWRKVFPYEAYSKLKTSLKSIDVNLLRMRLAMGRMRDQDFTSIASKTADPSRFQLNNPASVQMELIHQGLIIYISSINKAFFSHGKEEFTFEQAWNQELRDMLSNFTKILDTYMQESVHKIGPELSNLDVLSYNSFIYSMEELANSIISLGLDIIVILQHEKNDV